MTLLGGCLRWDCPTVPHLFAYWLLAAECAVLAFAEYIISKPVLILCIHINIKFGNIARDA